MEGDIHNMLAKGNSAERYLLRFRLRIRTGRQLDTTQRTCPSLGTDCCRLREFVVLYPAARIESLPALNGTRALMVVPRLGCDTIEKVPFTSFTRSCMLIRPKPGLLLAASPSKPTPESRTVR